MADEPTVNAYVVNVASLPNEVFVLFLDLAETTSIPTPLFPLHHHSCVRQVISVTAIYVHYIYMLC